MFEELKHCPFCNGEAELCGRETREFYNGEWSKEQAYNGVYDAAVRLAIEAIQVAAMAKKDIGTNKPKATKGTASTGINGQIAYICNACGGHVGRDDSFCGNCGAYFGE